ncbi:MAG: AAA family ATPase [bacterium]|nr:AAA family ATPase [bacterium]
MAWVTSEVRRSWVERRARVTGIDGASGIGKTALLNAVIGELCSEQALTLRVTCYEGQATAPRAALDRLIASGLAELDAPIRSRYAGGLEGPLASLGLASQRILNYEPAGTTVDADLSDRASLRLLDGLLLDYAVLVVLDDAQWLDPETARFLTRLPVGREERPLHMLISERERGTAPFNLLTRHTQFHIGELDPDASAILVKSVYGECSDDVIAAIVSYGQGIPVQIVAIASQAAQDHATQADDIARSVGAVCQREINAMPENARAFLQLCALLMQPVEYRVLRSLFNSDLEAASAISPLMGRYLEVKDGWFQFCHDAVQQAIQQTIVLPSVHQSRILEAILRIEGDSPELWRRIVYHARECGRRDLERSFVLKIAEDALDASAWDAAVASYERALAIREPEAAEHVAFYTGYGQALRAQLRLSDSQTVLERAIMRGRRIGLSAGFGPLAVSLVATAATLSDFDFAEHVYRDVTALLANARERLDMTAVMAVMYALEFREEQYLEVRAILDRNVDVLSDMAATYATIAEAIVSCRSGDFDRARQLFRVAKLRADTKRSVQALGIESQMIIEAAVTTGWASARERLTAFLSRYGTPSRRLVGTIEVLLDFMSGAWDAARAAIGEADQTKIDRAEPGFLSVGLAIDTLTGNSTIDLAAAELSWRQELEYGRWNSAALLGSWLLAVRGERNDAAVTRVLEALGRVGAGSLAWNLSFGATAPLALALYVDLANDEAVRGWVRRQPEPRDRTPWYRANYLLAQGIVRAPGQKPEALALIHEAEDIFRSLQAAPLAAIAAERGGHATGQERALLRELGVLGNSKSKRRGKGAGTATREILSRRELEIAELVASGAANREIASSLFLSERTVEAHLGNIFRKIEVNSRAQLTRWFVLR